MDRPTDEVMKSLNTSTRCADARKDTVSNPSNNGDELALIVLLLICVLLLVLL
jgi:hypothetical protein